MASMLGRILLSCRTSTLPKPLRSPFSAYFSPFSSNTTTPNPETPHPPIPLFLLTECDFSPSQISKLMQSGKPFLKTRSSNNAQEVVEFLKERGFTQPQLHTIILKYPPVLDCKVDAWLKPKFDFFRTLGFTDQELTNVISVYPRVLGQNLERVIIPQIAFLENLFGAKSNLIKGLQRSPVLLVDNIEKIIKSKLDFFKQWGIQGELLSLLVSKNPDVLVRWSTEILKEKMEYARNTMGIALGSKKFVYAISALLGNEPQTVEKKMKNLQSLGLQEGEVREILEKNPKLLTFSTKKLEENLAFLTQTAGLKANVVFSNSHLLQMSVKKRLMPRHAIFEALSSEQQSVTSLPTMFTLSERKFLVKIVECNPQASRLKKIYKDKMES